MPVYSVTESNSSATTTINGSVSSGGNFKVVGVDFAGQSQANVDTSFRGTFGTLTLRSDGTFTYVLDNADPDTNVLPAGTIVPETFTYSYVLNGVSSTAKLIFQVSGVDEVGQVNIVTDSYFFLTSDTTFGPFNYLRSTAQYGVMLNGPRNDTLNFTNDGAVTVSSASNSSVGLGVWEFTPIEVINNGLFDVLGHNGQAMGINFGPLINNGVVHVVADRAPGGGSFAGQASGVGGASVVNNGLIDVTSVYGRDNGDAIAVSSNYLVNHGIVRATGAGAQVIVAGQVARAVVAVNASTGAYIENSGTIEAVSTDPTGHAVAIYIFPSNTNVYQPATIYNSGRIVGDEAILATEGYNVALTVTNTNYIEGNVERGTGGLDVFTNTAGARWIGDFRLGTASDVFRNAGTITGSISLNDGADFFDGRGGVVSGIVSGGGGSDVLMGGSVADQLDGGAQADWIQGGGGADRLTGGEGADTFVYEFASDSTAAASDLITDFQAGTDRLDLSALSPSNVSIVSAGADWLVTGKSPTGDFSIKVQGTISSSDIITVRPEGTQANDILRAGDGGVRLNGLGGDDVLIGGSGNDTLDGGTGADMMFGGSGDDLYIVDNGNDRILEAPDSGHDTVWTSVDYSLQSSVEDAVLLGNGSIGILGNALNNRLDGNAGNNLIRGADGDDILFGGLGADILEGGLGTDRYIYTSASQSTSSAPDHILISNKGADVIDVDAIVPILYSFSKPGHILANEAYASIFSDFTRVEILTATNATMVLWVTGTATLQQFSFNAPLIGSALNDALIGSSEGNSINGLDGNDTINGLDGNDTLTGGAGRDILTGGSGDDLFKDSASGLNGDTITDFDAGDSIVITDAKIASFAFNLSGNTLTYTGGTLTFESSLPGKLVATAAVNGGVQLNLVQQFSYPGAVLVNNFAVGAGGWSSQDRYPRHIADVNGDGFSDIVGFGQAGVLVSFGSANGVFSGPGLVLANFGQSSGWSSDNQFHRELADVNGDGRADIVGFGTAGTLVSFGRTDGTFTGPFAAVSNFGANQGWSTQDGFARVTGDVNGDKMADIIGFGLAGTFVSLGNGDGTFTVAALTVANFGVQQGWTSDNQFHRTVADVNGDGLDDIIGFGYAGAYVALSNGDGSFKAPTLAVSNFGKDQGWSSQDSFARQVADVNGDGRADIVGFGVARTYVAYGLNDGTFASVSFDVANFGANQGWTSDNSYHRELADINNDGTIDIVGFGQAGVLAGYNQAHWLA